MQAKQYECPQGRVAGSFRVSRHTGQTNVSSSDQAEAIGQMSWRSDLDVLKKCKGPRMNGLHSYKKKQRLFKIRTEIVNGGKSEMLSHMNHRLFKNQGTLAYGWNW